MYTLRDTPMFTCRNLPLAETLDSLGGAPIAADAALEMPDQEGWLSILPLSDLGEGESQTVYFSGKQVAIFNVGGTVYAVSNRCSHARGPLSEGQISVEDGESCTVTCPWHYAKFDLSNGRVVDGVASASVSAYESVIRNGMICLRERLRSHEAIATTS
jgi:nitrite reductase/ring-hydroxylating ferredoxin subunit